MGLIMNSVFQTVEPTVEELEKQKKLDERKRTIQRLLEGTELTSDEVLAFWNGYIRGTELNIPETKGSFIGVLMRVIHDIEWEIDPRDFRFNPNELLLLAFALGYGAGEKNNKIEIVSLLKELENIEDELY